MVFGNNFILKFFVNTKTFKIEQANEVQLQKTFFWKCGG